MLELLQIDLAVCAVVIMVAAFVVVMRWRRSSAQPQMPVREWRRAVAGLVDKGLVNKGMVDRGMAQREVADVPGRSVETVDRERGAPAPAPAEPEQAAPAQLSNVATAEPEPDRPGADPDEQEAAAGAVTISERIAGYYDEADQPVADYLAALGWDRAARAPCPQAADAPAAPASAEAAAEPGTARPHPVPIAHPGVIGYSRPPVAHGRPDR